MRALLLLTSIALLAACSDDPPTPQAAAPPPPVPIEKADVAAAEMTDSDTVTDPCDLRGYDMTKMTVDMHEELVKACDRSKQ